MRRMGNRKIKVLVVDDHAMVRAGIVSFLQKQESLCVVGEASGGQEALNNAKTTKPDVIIMDLMMSGMDGLETTTAMIRTLPKAKVLIFTAHERNEHFKQVVESGGRGYLTKTSEPQDLLLAIHRVHEGATAFTADMASSLFEEYVQSRGRLQSHERKRLSPREAEVLALVVDGMANKEIANHIGLSVRTVEKHRQRIMNKLEIHKATELVKYALTQSPLALLTQKARTGHATDSTERNKRT